MRLGEDVSTRYFQTGRFLCMRPPRFWCKDAGIIPGGVLSCGSLGGEAAQQFVLRYISAGRRGGVVAHRLKGGQALQRWPVGLAIGGLRVQDVQ